MRTHQNPLIGSLVVAGLVAAPALLQAQPTAHYAPGTEGLKAATLPPPGVYVRDYNQFYYADHVNDKHGDKIAGQDAFVYAQVPRVLWITDQQFLGGYLGMDALIPLKYTWLKGIDQTWGVGDLFAEGTWSKHIEQWDFALGAGVWAPTGDPVTKNPTYAGNGYWTEMLTAGATWYLDKEKQWSLSALNRYEFNQEQERSHGVTPGQAYTVEGGLGYGFTKTIEGGVITYYQQQVNTDHGGNSNNLRDRVCGVGPEIGIVIPSWMTGITLRYAYEWMAENRLQGNTWTLTITKRF